MNKKIAAIADCYSYLTLILKVVGLLLAAVAVLVLAVVVLLVLLIVDLTVLAALAIAPPVLQGWDY